MISSIKLMIVFSTFCTFLIWDYFHIKSSQIYFNWKNPNRLIDLTGLLVQGLAIPILQVAFVVWVLNNIFPFARGSVLMNPVLIFMLNFIVIDYAYYWNHRLLHGKTLWNWHAVHHTAERMDVWVTSRNTLWSPLFIIYLWLNGFFIFVLRDPAPFILSASITAALDIWRHSELSLQKGTLIHLLISSSLITPHEHSWHHSTNKPDCNFGANLNWWDKLHGTYFSPEAVPIRLGVSLPMNIWRKLFYPFKQELQ